ncbi:hypothetical protein Bca4012_025756 [Brassica carinata]
METKLEPEAQPKQNQELEAGESKAGDDLDLAKSIKKLPIIVETLHTIFPLPLQLMKCRGRNHHYKKTSLF